jgi:hypothetical protein
MAQTPGDQALGKSRQAHAAVVRLGREAADSLWPGFRPDTIPVLYVLPELGTLLLGWTGPLPSGFSALSPGQAGWKPAAERGAASTGTMLGGRGTAQLVVHDQDLAAVVGLSVHEAFHVHARAAGDGRRRFGRGENSFLVSTYPVFDAANEAGMALEGRLLAAALDTSDPERQRALARAFVAARESRHRRLGPTLAEFEQQAELNEGLAEYQLIRSAELAARGAIHSDTAGATRLVRELPHHLRTLTEDVRQSLRLRFYRLGPAQAMLLDRLEGPSWKRRLLDHNLTLQDALADASGARDPERAVLARASTEFDAAALGRSAEAAVERLRILRQRQVDSLLSAPGLRIFLTLDSMPGRSVGLCGIDPQNLLQVDAERLLHTRWVRPCSGSALQATFTTPVVQDSRQGVWQAVLIPGDTIRIRSGGAPFLVESGGRPVGVTDLEITSAGLELRAARAELWRDSRSLFIRVMP